MTPERRRAIFDAAWRRLWNYIVDPNGFRRAKNPDRLKNRSAWSVLVEQMESYRTAMWPAHSNRAHDPRTFVCWIFSPDDWLIAHVPRCDYEIEED